MGKRWWLVAAVVAVVAIGGYLAWDRFLRTPALPDGIVAVNGRIEAEQIDVATKIPGRVAQMLVEEGQMVQADEVVARLDTATLDAQLAAAQAQVEEANQGVAAALANLIQTQSSQRQATLDLERTRSLAGRGFAPQEQLDQRQTALDVANATVASAEAGQRRAEATLKAAKAQLAEAQTALDDATLKAPRAGRVLYRLVREGEVLGAGGRVVTMIDPLDVSMIVFLPTSQAGLLAYGAEARLVLDPVPQYVIPATVSFVAPNAQFTPRSVETSIERENLMFRVKLRIPVELLTKHAEQVKGGVRGMAYVRLDPNVAWPERLQVKLP